MRITRRITKEKVIEWASSLDVTPDVSPYLVLAVVLADNRLSADTKIIIPTAGTVYGRSAICSFTPAMLRVLKNHNVVISYRDSREAILGLKKYLSILLDEVSDNLIEVLGVYKMGIEPSNYDGNLTTSARLYANRCIEIYDALTNTE